MINTLLSSKLMKMSNADQAMRNSSSGDDSQWDDELDKRNTAMLKGILQKYGWPTKALVGNKASHAAWLLAWRADHSLDFQILCLNSMKQQPLGEVSK